MEPIAIDAIVSRHCLLILDGKKEAILSLAQRLRELGHPNADRVEQIHRNQYFSAPRDESVAVLLALAEDVCWGLTGDFADHWMNEIGANTSPTSKHAQIVALSRARSRVPVSEDQLAKLLEDAPRYYQSWASARTGQEAAIQALCGILAFSATGGREPAWQHGRIREYMLAGAVCR